MSWISAGGVPVYVDDATGMPAVPPPGEAPPAPAPGTEVATGTANRGGYTSSSVAMDPKIYGAVEGADRRILGAQPALQAQADARLAPYADAEVRAAGDRYAAQDQQSQALAQQAQAQAEGDRALAELNDRFANAETSARKIAAARAANYRAGYETQLRQWASAGVQVPDTGIAGAVTAFVTDFLGTRGIHSSGMDILNQAVDRSIQTQLDNMRHGGEVTQEFRALWQAAQADSDSESEARAKIFGYHLAGAQQLVAAEVAKYGGPLALAQGKAAQAQIEEELQQHLAAIEDTAYTRAQNQMKTLLDTEHQAQALAIQRSSVGAQWYNANTERMKVQQAAKADPHLQEKIDDLNSRMVPDPRDPNHLLGAARTKEQADKIRENLPKWASFEEKGAALRDLLVNRDLYLGPGHRFTNAQYDQAVEAAWTDYLTDYGYMKSGAQYSDKFLDKLEGAAPIKSWSTDPDIEATYSRLISDSIDNAQRHISSQVAPLTSWEKDLVNQGLVSPVGSSETYGAARGADVKLGMQEGHGQAPETPVDKAEGLVTRKTDHRIGDPALEAKVAEETAAAGVNADAHGDMGLVNGTATWAEGMHDLYVLTTDKDQATRHDAVKALAEFTQDPDQNRAVLAQWYLSQVAPDAAEPPPAPSEVGQGEYGVQPIEVPQIGRPVANISPTVQRPDRSPVSDIGIADGLSVPKVELPPLTDEQVRELLKKYGHVSSPQLP